MDTKREFDDSQRSGGLAPTMRPLAPTVAIAVLLGVVLAVGAPTIAMDGGAGGPAAPVVEAFAEDDLVSSQLTTQPALASSDSAGRTRPDKVADFVGGIAARVHFGDGTPVPGDLFLLMAVAGSDFDARVYDRTAHPLDRDETHPDTIESNQQAVRIVEDITDTEVRAVDFTSAPGGGPSAGITYVIAYLNIISDGAFTGDVVVAATGRLEPQGYVYPVDGVNEKAAAARFAGADVLFTPSVPDAELVEVHGARVVGELFRARDTGSALTEERQWDHYVQWGMERPPNDMDVVGIRHVGDVAAYLCGAGSDFACDVSRLLESDVIEAPSTRREDTSCCDAVHGATLAPGSIVGAAALSASMAKPAAAL